MSERWGTYHNPESLRNAWRIGLIGGPMALGWLLISLMAPVQIPVVQGLAVVVVFTIGLAVFRLGSERVSTDQGGVTVYPAFRRAAYVAWPDLASLDTRVHLVNNAVSGEIEDLAAALFDLDSGTEHAEIQSLFLVTRSGKRIAVPSADARTRALIESGWREYSANFGRRLFND